MNEIQKLARGGNKKALAIMDAFDPDQERDEDGKWTSGGGGGGGSGGGSGAASSMKAVTTETSGVHGPNNTWYPKGHPMYDKIKAEKSSSKAGAKTLRTTQKELPAIAKMTTKQLAPHATQIASGMQEGRQIPYRMGSDPNAKTQQLPAMPDHNEAKGRVTVETPGVHGPNNTWYPKGHPMYDKVKASKNTVESRPLSRQDRVQAAAASAGQWASRSLSVRPAPLREGGRTGYSSSTSKGRLPPLREGSRYSR